MHEAFRDIRRLIANLAVVGALIALPTAAAKGLGWTDQTRTIVIVLSVIAALMTWVGLSLYWWTKDAPLRGFSTSTANVLQRICNKSFQGLFRRRNPCVMAAGLAVKDCLLDIISEITLNYIERFNVLSYEIATESHFVQGGGVSTTGLNAERLQRDIHNLACVLDDWIGCVLELDENKEIGVHVTEGLRLIGDSVGSVATRLAEIDCNLSTERPEGVEYDGLVMRRDHLDDEIKDAKRRLNDLRDNITKLRTQCSHMVDRLPL